MASLIVNMQAIGAVGAGAAGEEVQDVSYDGDEFQRVQLCCVRWLLVLVALSCNLRIAMIPVIELLYAHLEARLTAFD